MKKIIIISIFIILIVLVSGIFIYQQALKPVKSAEEKAVQTAMEETELTKAEDFYLYNGQETYYVVKGKNEKGKNIYVWIPEKEGRIIVRKQSDGVSEKEAVSKLLEEKNPKEIISVRLGMEKNIPLWEIYYRSEGDLINYYYVDFQTGEWLKKIENL
ncbi:cell wall elongation regulator TseB-like domain-containing protein [Cytobacillus massiliigabonensis]|uniref:cell wall elongation regulator TseB-like domain-containing protein n=1 Tax=Cytobacillus massiliigabonensis TaxID=1871011 RepID=UPI000C863834|nr:DUF5590 domain-containing protein [Cytobacillus massiliigabonensis]